MTRDDAPWPDPIRTGRIHLPTEAYNAEPRYRLTKTEIEWQLAPCVFVRLPDGATPNGDQPISTESDSGR